MNYFPFHIGDYLSATRHLSWEEDMAYRRLLDTYYTTEKALPVDVRACCRLVMAQTKAQREAVRVVLEEYFVQAADGWHNKRADDELTAMFAKHEQQLTKDEHEAERMRRYRERRAEMFAALRERNIVPAWDVPIKELQRLFDANCTEPATPPATDLQREQNEYGGVTCNGDATAIPTPTPTPTPVVKNKSIVAALLAEVDAQIAADWQAMRKAKRAPVTATAIEGIQREAGKAGISLQDALAMCCQRGWTGFKADWAGVNGQRAPPNGMTPYQQMQVEKHEQNKRFNTAILGDKSDGRTDAIDGIADRVD